MREMKPENKSTYEKPAIIHRELMESVAGACDTQDPINGKTGTPEDCTILNS